MAIAIKQYLAETLYGDLTRNFTDKGRRGKIQHCSECGEAHVLYYGETMSEEDATGWLQAQLPKMCPDHKGWVCVDEAAPVSVERHQELVRQKVLQLQADAHVLEAEANHSDNRDRERLVGLAARKRGEIRELEQEL